MSTKAVTLTLEAKDQGWEGDVERGKEGWPSRGDPPAFQCVEGSMGPENGHCT